jgi:hypothetical protein
MFFAKALAGSMVVVFGGFWVLGAFDRGHEVVPAVEKAPRIEIKQRKTVAWGPHCNKLRDELFGISNGIPVDRSEVNGVTAILKLHKISAKLKAAGCDPDEAPGAFSPFEPNKGGFRKVTSTMSDPQSGFAKPDSRADTSGASYGKPDPRASAPVSNQDTPADDGWGIPAQK